MTDAGVGLAPGKAARAAGYGYLILIIAGIFAEFFVRGKLIAPGDAAATAGNILAAEGLFRFGFISDLLMVVCDVTVTLLLYVLLRPVNKHLALLAAFFRLAMNAVLALNMLNHYAALLLLQGGGYLAVFEAGQLRALALFFLDAHGYGYLISQVLFGPHQLVLGYLIYKSDYIPRVLGVMIALAALGYLTESFTEFLFPGHEAITAPGLAVAGIAELSLCLWLIIRGGRVRPQQAA